MRDHNHQPDKNSPLRTGLRFGISSFFLALLVNLMPLEGAVTLAEIVYQNTIGDVRGAYSKTEEYGDQVILGGDGTYVLSFSFEYRGQFKPDGDETCILRFYANDGESIPAGNNETRARGTLLFESQPFRIFPDFNTASVTDINVDVTRSFTWTVEFSGLRGISTDRAGLVLRHPPDIGMSFDDFWVKDTNGWAPYRFNGDPMANFACVVIADPSLRFTETFDRGKNPPSLTVRGPQGDTIIIYASDDKVRWQPIALETLGSRGVQVIDHSFTQGQTRYYRAAIINELPLELTQFVRQPDGVTEMTVTGPVGMPFALQASSDCSNWTNLFELFFPAKPSLSVQDIESGLHPQRFYRLQLMDVVQENPDTADEATAVYPRDFTLE